MRRLKMRGRLGTEDPAKRDPVLPVREPGLRGKAAKGTRLPRPEREREINPAEYPE